MTYSELRESLEEWEADCYLQQESENPTERRIADGMLKAILQEQANVEDDEFLAMFHRDPITQSKTGWYFYDEAWCNLIGPYNDRASALTALKKYVKGLL